jgi:hypothetical protein
MESIINLFESLFEKAKEYSKTSIELLKLKIVEKTTSLASSIVIIFIVLFCFMLFIIPFNVGIALYLGEVFGKLWYGFLIVSGFYLFVIIIILLFFRKSIKKAISNYIVRRIMK